MPKTIYYPTVGGGVYAHRCGHPGPKPQPKHLRRSERCAASLTPATRARLDAEIILTHLSESDIITDALRQYFAALDQERILYGLLHSNQYIR